MSHLPLGLDLFTFEAPTLIELHQASTHFPIALLLTSLGCDGAGAIWKRAQGLRITARWTQMLGTLGAIATTALGWFGNPVRSQTNEYAQMVTVHQWWGVATLAVFVLLALWRIGRHGTKGKIERGSYVLLSILGAAIIAITGWLGGNMGG